MCGIVGLITNNILANLLASLNEMENRGTDSSGVAIINTRGVFVYKETGKLNNLVAATKNFTYKDAAIGIGHTRWATHGRVTTENAHPHSGKHSLLVHNGIIENYLNLRSELIAQNVQFFSDTDSEVIVHLFERLLDQTDNPIQALHMLEETLEGSFAVLLISSRYNDRIFFLKKSLPLILGRGNKITQVVSSTQAFQKGIKQVYYIPDGVYGYFTSDQLEVFRQGSPIEPLFKKFSTTQSKISKGRYSTYMEKEIREQHLVLNHTIRDRVLENDIVFPELPVDFFDGLNRIIFCACGTSYHSGLAASYLLEQHTNIIANTVLASEFIYKKPVLKKDDLVILISQSGETADVLSALRICQSHEVKTLAISNTEHSTLVRESLSLLSHIGVEKSVASTKAFSSQLLLLWAVILHIAKRQNPSIDLTIEINNIHNAIKACKVTPKLNDDIKNLVNQLEDHKRYLFLGRHIFYPLALEGALKLKEITYLSAEGYAAGEMKHGPIAIADNNLYTIALNPTNLLFNKTASNITELASRDSKIILISPHNMDSNYYHIKTLNTNSYMVEFFRTLIILQLFALHIATKQKRDIDTPRNLAKSVTVE